MNIYCKFCNGIEFFLISYGRAYQNNFNPQHFLQSKTGTLKVMKKIGNWNASFGEIKF